MQYLSDSITNQRVVPVQKSESIETKIFLKRLTSDDLKCFYEWASDSEVTKTMTWEAYTSISEAEKFLKEIVESHPWFKAIYFDGKPIGSITLTQGKGSSSCRAELGYVLARSYWNKGIATEAVKLALKQGFDDLKIQRIEALVDPGNIASEKVLIKAGMTNEGFLKNYIIFKGTVRDRKIYSSIRLQKIKKSHLRLVDPVVDGQVKAKQIQSEDEL